MKRTLFLFIWLFLTFDTLAQGDKWMKRDTFTARFMEHVEAHKKWKTRRCLNKKYCTSQLAFLSGNKKQFFDELFSGEDLISGDYISIVYSEIVSVSIIEIAEITEGDKTAWVYIFKISDGKHEARCPLLLERHARKFGFIGAVG